MDSNDDSRYKRNVEAYQAPVAPSDEIEYDCSPAGRFHDLGNGDQEGGIVGLFDWVAGQWLFCRAFDDNSPGRKSALVAGALQVILLHDKIEATAQMGATPRNSPEPIIVGENDKVFFGQENVVLQVSGGLDDFRLPWQLVADKTHQRPEQQQTAQNNDISTCRAG